MQPIYILVVSAAVTGGIVYGTYYLTRSKRRRSTKKTGLKGLDLEIEEEFLDEIVGGFEGKVYKKSQDSAQIKVEKVNVDKEYPDCFGTSERFRTCARDCGVSEECTSTVNILEGF